MLKIGIFSKLSLLTVKALRFYEKEGLLIPAHIDEWTGYRFYETSQLAQAAKIKAYRQIDLSVEDKQMNYQAVIKEIPETIVYYEERRLDGYPDLMTFVPESGAECKRLNPDLKCAEPPYEFCEYLDGEYRHKDILVRHSQAVTEFGKENERIKFRKIPATKIISIYHKGAYDNLGEAYAYIMRYAEAYGYKIAGLARESYIDGIWNKELVDEWLTDIQLPIEG